MDHLDGALSAYLDGELDGPARAMAQRHLDACGRCTARLAELRSTARLVSSLPTARPTRSLVPRLNAVPAWARPLRTLASLTAGILLFVTIASFAVSTGLGGGGRGALLVPNVGAQRETSAQGAPAAPAAGAPAPSAQGFNVSAPKAAQDSANASSTPRASAAPRASSTPTSNVTALSRPEPTARPNEIGPSPLLWLGLTILAALVAWAAHRRATSA